MKSLIVSTFLLLGSFQMMAQPGAYNAFNEFQAEKLKDYLKTMETQTVTQRNKVNKSTLVEIFEQGTGKFMGYWGDPKKVKFSELPYFKRNKGIKKLAKQHTLPIAVAIFQNEVIKGMTSDQVELSWGEANKIEPEEGENKSIMRYDDVFVHLEDEKVISIEWLED